MNSYFVTYIESLGVNKKNSNQKKTLKKCFVKNGLKYED